MNFLRTCAGVLVGTCFNFILLRFIPFVPDLTDWGGRAYPREYVLPLMIAVAIFYMGGWLGSKLSPTTGRLVGMLASLVTVSVFIKFTGLSNILEPLFHHPAYPIFTDHALLALALILVAGHIGGFRIEKTSLNSGNDSVNVKPDLTSSKPA